MNPPSELMTLFNPEVISPPSDGWSSYAPQGRYTFHLLPIKNIQLRLVLHDVLCFFFFLLHRISLLEQAKEVSLQLQTNQVGALF